MTIRRLVLPGGVANPDILRMDGRAVAFVRSFFDHGKPVAVMLATAPGRWWRLTSSRDRMISLVASVRTDIRNAGGNWVDQQVAM